MERFPHENAARQDRQIILFKGGRAIPPYGAAPPPALRRSRRRTAFPTRLYRLVFQEHALFCVPAVKVFGQIGLDAAFRRVDLQSHEDGERLGVHTAFVPLFVLFVLVVGDDAQPQRRVADLPYAGGKGALYSFGARFPIVRVGDQRFRRRDLEYRQ